MKRGRACAEFHSAQAAADAVAAGRCREKRHSGGEQVLYRGGADPWMCT